jgi:hypothetical protein
MSEDRGCLANTLLFLVIIFVPVVGHIIETVMILEDDRSLAGKLIWLAVIWLLPPFVILGPLLYLLFGQRPKRRAPIMFAQPSQAYYQRQRI